MERLTFDGNFCDIAQCTEMPCPYGLNCAQKQVWERLKAYEDTGLAPIACAVAAERDKELIRTLRYCADVSKVCGACPMKECRENGRGILVASKAADRLEDLTAENEHLREVTKMVSQWVSVKEQLPEYEEDVLVYRPGMERTILLTRYERTGWIDGDVRYAENGFENGAITHWVKLPEPPSTEGVE